jgi:3-deoxy-D-manno-octulosonic acid (KDO) 8-phosphate synthase
MSGIGEKLISPSQMIFIPGRNIMEGVVMLHETIHEIHRKRMSGVALKLDFKNAYDKVNWNFL